MSPNAARIAILITELLLFFVVTAFATYFISHAGALHLEPADQPPARFPVIAYDGDRDRPDAKNYRVVPWSEWEGLAATRPGASLLLPERSGRVRIGASQATFAAAPSGELRQTVELQWSGNDGEQHVRYIAQARTIEPQYYRTVTTNMFLMGATLGFITGLLTGRVMRRRWLVRPPVFAPPPRNN